VEEMMGKVKPLNLLKFIGDLLIADSHLTRINLVVVLLETYGFYWRPTCTTTRAAFSSIVEGIVDLRKKTHLLDHFPLAEGTNDSSSTVGGLANHANGDAFDEFMEQLGHHLPKELLDVAPIAKIALPAAFVAFSGLGLTGVGGKVAKVAHAMASNLKDSKVLFESFAGMHSFVSDSFKAAFEPEKLHLKAKIAEDIVNLIAELKKFRKDLDDNVSEVIARTEYVADIFKKVDDVEELCGALASLKENTASLSPLIMTLLALRKEVAQKLKAVIMATKSRAEPTCVWLYGASGVGKSRFVAHLVKLLSGHEGASLSVCSRNSVEAFNSTYVGQPVYVYDDFGSAIEGTDVDEFIPMKSCNPYGVIKASVEEKGTAFTSPYIIICSNQVGINGHKKVTNPDAINRRRDFLIHVVDDVATQANAYNRELPADHYKKDFSHLTLTRLNPIPVHNQYMPPQTGPRTLTPKQLAAAMYAKRLHYRLTHEESLREPTEDENEDDDEEEEDEDVDFDEDNPLTEQERVQYAMPIFRAVDLDPRGTTDRMRAAALAAMGDGQRQQALFPQRGPQGAPGRAFRPFRARGADYQFDPTAHDAHDPPPPPPAEERPRGVQRMGDNFFVGGPGERGANWRFRGNAEERVQRQQTFNAADAMLDLGRRMEEEMQNQADDDDNSEDGYDATTHPRRIFISSPTTHGAAVDQHFVSGKRSIVLVGPAGVLKTTWCREFQAIHPEYVWLENYDEYNTDEFTANPKRFRNAIERIWGSAEDREHPHLFACNTGTLDAALKEANVLPEAFNRRVVLLTFSLSPIAAAKKKLNILGRGEANFDLKPCIQVHYQKISVGQPSVVHKKLTYSKSLIICSKDEIVETVRKHTMHVPQWTAPMPESTLLFPCKRADSHTVTFADFWKMATEQQGPNSIGAISQAQLILDFAPAATLRGDSWEELLIQFNALGLTSRVELVVGLLFTDKSCVLDTTTGKIKILDVPERRDQDSFYQAQKNRIAGIVEKARESADAITIFIDALFFALKTIAGIGLGVYNIVRSNEIRKKCNAFDEVMALGNEGRKEPYKTYFIEEDHTKSWSESMAGNGLPDDVNDYDFGPTGTPKTARQGKRIMTYCYDCHSADCGHCFDVIYNESWEERVRRQPVSVATRPKPTVKELSNEGKGLLTALRGGITKEYKQRGGKQLAERKAKGAELSPAASSRVLEPVSVLRDPKPVAIIDVLPKRVFKTDLESESRNGDIENHALIDETAANLTKILRGNVVFVGAPHNIKLRGLMVGGNVGATNSHAFCSKKEGDLFTCFDMKGTSYVGQIEALDFYKDICIFRLSNDGNTRGSPCFRDIRQHIASKKDAKVRVGVRAWLAYYYPDNTTVLTNILVGDVLERKIEGVLRFGTDYHGHANGTHYGPIGSSVGLCGSPCIVNNTSIARKIVSLHSAANRVTGFGAFLFVEDFEPYFPKALANHASDVESIVILGHQNLMPIETIMHGHYRVVGVAYDYEKDDVIHQYVPDQTRLWASPLALPGEKPFEPVVLSPKDARLPYDYDPYVDGMEKYNRLPADMNLELLDFCVREVGDYYATLLKTKGFSTHVLTKTEALNGCSEYHTSSPINRGTSPGFPWRHLPGCDKKGGFVEFDPTRQIWTIKKDPSGAKLVHAVDAIIDCARRGIRTACLNIGLLKDELRKTKKIYEAPATRAIWAAPFDQVLAVRMYFHAAQCAIGDTHEHHPIKVGINPIGIGFHALYNYHARISTRGFDLDAANWDSSLPLCVLQRLHIAWNAIYKATDPDWKPEDDIIRETLISYDCEPMVMYRDFAVVLPTGHISGTPLTSINNSIAHHIYHFYIWMTIMRRFNRLNIANHHGYVTHVATSLYGDDVMNTVHESVADIFTPEAFIAEGAKFGVNYTPAAKVDKVTWKHLSQLEFLKRNFARAEMPNGRPSPYWCGRLQEDVFHKILDFVQCKKQHDFWKEPETINFDNCTIAATVDSALLEATNHGQVFFNRMREHLMNACRDWGITVDRWPSYSACYFSIWDTGLPDAGSLAVYEEDFENQSDAANQRFNMPVQPAVVGGPGAPTESGAPPTGHTATPFSGRQETSGGPSAMVNVYTGEPGMLPNDLYHKPIVVGNITWSSTAQAGTKLATYEISPQGCNQYIQYFAAPWRAWAGDIEWEVMVVGTGFNGGKLGMCRVPPGYNPNNAVTLADLTVFPYTVADVKEAAVISKKGADERNVMFHWSAGVGDSSIDQTGGTVIIYVMSPLINASGEPCTVNVLVFNKLAANFRVAQLMPIEEAAQNEPIEDAQVLMPNGTIVTDPYIGQPVTKFAVLSQTTYPELIAGYYGLSSFAGKYVGRPYVPWEGQPIAVNAGVDEDGPAYVFGTGVSEDVTRPLTYDMTSIAGGAFDMTFLNSPNGLNQYGQTAGTAVRVGTGVYSLLIPYTSATDIGGEVDGNNSFVAGFGLGNGVFNVIPDTRDTSGPASIQPSLPESFVVFQSDNLGQWNSTDFSLIVCAQTTATIAGLQSQNLSSLVQPGQALMWAVSSISTGLVVMYVKQYYEGYFTTNASSTNVFFDYSAFKWQPVEIMLATTPLPPSTQAAQNQLLLTATRQGITTRGEVHLPRTGRGGRAQQSTGRNRAARE